VSHGLEVGLKTNELTGKQAYWVLVRTLGDVEIDVVIHPTTFD
jgi:hypothetical protein